MAAIALAAAVLAGRLLLPGGGQLEEVAAATTGTVVRTPSAADVGHQAVRPGCYHLIGDSWSSEMAMRMVWGSMRRKQGPKELCVGLFRGTELPHLGQEHGEPLAA